MSVNTTRKRQQPIEPLETRRLLSVVRLDDVAPGAVSSTPAQLAPAGDYLYFTATDADHGTELWRTRGGVAQAALVKDINPGTGSANISEPIEYDGSLYFTADDGGSGEELWKSDGTAAGTVKVADIRAGSASSSPYNLRVFNGLLYFAADDGTTGVELWRTDGSAAGTGRVADINPGATGSFISSPVVSGGQLFFAADDGVTGLELWRFDGINIAQVADIYPGATSSNPYDLVDAAGTLYFAADNGTNGTELWSATASGAALVRDIRVGVISSTPYALATIENIVYFAADSGLPGTELMRSDGTFDGTRVVRDINPNFNSSYPYSLTPVGTELYFVANNGFVDQLWRSDGTQQNTQVVLGSGSMPMFPYALTAVGSNLYFAATDQTGAELWKTSTSATTAGRVADIDAAGSSDPYDLHSFKGQCYFAASEPGTGFELWMDDTVAPTVTGGAFEFETAQTIVLRFNEPVGASLSVNDLAIVDLATNQPVPAAGFTLSYDDSIDEAEFVIVGAAGALPDGNYRASLPAGAVSDAVGTANSAEFSLGFFVFAGDANRDRNVDIGDFSALASHFNLPSTFSQGDFDYSGTVDIGDFAIIASKFNTSLPMAGAPQLESANSDDADLTYHVVSKEIGLAQSNVSDPARRRDILPSHRRRIGISIQPAAWPVRKLVRITPAPRPLLVVLLPFGDFAALTPMRLRRYTPA